MLGAYKRAPEALTCWLTDRFWYRKHGVLISQLEKFCLFKVQDEQNDFVSGLAFPNQHLRIL